MKIKLKVNSKVREKDYKTVWMKERKIFFIDQRKLPEKFEIFCSKNTQETALAIREMVVRGAPAIGATGAYGLAQGALNFSGSSMKNFLKHLEKTEKILKETRPTAFDLFYALKEAIKEVKKSKSVKKAQERAKKFSFQYAQESQEKCKRIGEFGQKLIKSGDKILTHCNAGALACVDYGTALSPLRFAHYSGKKIFVWVSETRPRLQGAKLTAWELFNEGISHSLIVDSAAGYFMRKGEVDLCIVGADRVAKNGDVANKIGTYEKAVLAKENNIPFYVAAPLTTFDKNCQNGEKIKIEERSENEVLFCGGKNKIAPDGSKARNPAFDITPKKYISAFITEKGIFTPEEIKKIL